MSLPFDDWQFWVTTAAALVALWLVARAVAPRRKRPKRTDITIGGKRP